MCGLVAIWKPSAAAEQVRAELVLGTASLHHRGPDQRGTWVGPKVRIGLGHTRLAIVDPQGGSQPLASEDGQIQVIVNGEFYGWKELRLGLESQGHRFASKSDSEVLIYLYREYGLACLDLLRGEFAFVLWDAAKQRLVAARDRFGIKPLVYARGERGQLMIASEAKALFAMGLCAAWSKSAFADVTSHQYLAPGQSLFAGVHTLPPGHLLIAEKDQWSTHSYWSLDYPVEQPAKSGSSRDAEHAERIFSLLSQSVSLRLQGDFPVACYLSGGIDSSATAALATKHSSKPVTCFGIAFDDAQYDEHKDAAEFASSIGAHFSPVHVSGDAILGVLSDAVIAAEGLCINGQLSAKFLLSKATAAAGFKSVLVGEGADELFGGYSHLLRDYLQSRVEQGDLDATRRLLCLAQAAELQAGVMFPASSGAAPQQEGTLPCALVAKLQMGVRMQNFLREDACNEKSRVASLLQDSSVAQELPQRHSVDQSTILWMRSALATYILKTLGDGTEMAHSIEGRAPFLDHKLFEYARHIPPASRFRGDIAKSILRKALGGLLPESLCMRPKRPLLAPPVCGQRGTRGWEQALDLVHSQCFTQQPFWDAKKLAPWIAALDIADPGACREADPIVMLALSTHALQQGFSLGWTV